MYYYDIAIIGRNIANLTYQSAQKIKIGQRVFVQLGAKQTSLKDGVIVDVLDNKPKFKCKDIAGITSEYYDAKQMKIARYISKYYVCYFSKSIELFTPFGIYCHASGSGKKSIQDGVILSQSQQRAYEFCLNNKQSLIYGVTGSGKSEVYIKAIKHYLKQANQNNQVLFLVPEIALTPSMLERLKNVFNDRVGVYHSQITKKQKKVLINKLHCGDIDLIVGARSAFFLPFKNLSLIIVDEENDISYKSASNPCINVKDLSIYYSKIYNKRVILGSATPSLTSYHTIKHIEIKSKYHKGDNNIIYENSEPKITPLIEQKIRQTLDNNKQVIVFIPIRGNFKTSYCASCNNVVECINCSSSLTYYERDNIFKCHHCNWVEPFYSKCKECEGEMESVSIGTDEIHKQLKSSFEDAKIGVLDRNNANTNKKLNVLLDSFANGGIDILIGTQMITKGHNYPNVSLVVAIGLDLALYMPSFSARQNALCACFQICGRSGREGAGEVVVQSNHCSFYQKYLELGYSSFIKDELKNRQGMYPPYKHIARIMISGKNKQTLQAKMLKCLDIFDKDKINIIGYGQNMLFKLKNTYRYDILIASKDDFKYMLQVCHIANNRGYMVDMDIMS